MIVLGLETSCDETAVGIVDDGRRILANVVATQFEEHKPYGGVVPEIAARAHLDCLDVLIQQALRESGLGFDALSGIAATCGPGLIGGVMVGAMTGKALAAVRGLPFLAVNHLEAHALTARLTDDVRFPYLLLLVSGGHCQLLLVKSVGDYRRLGTTLDDAVGECFDKSAKLLGLGYPGGPQIERVAKDGNPRAFSFPRPMLGREGCDFSFSGLKTAVRAEVERWKMGEKESPPPTLQPPIADLAASLQAAIADILADRTRHALAQLSKGGEPVTSLVAAGGVAANKAIGCRLKEIAAENGVPFVVAPPALCTDNGVMVAWAGLERLRLGQSDGFDVKARPRWPLSSSIE